MPTSQISIKQFKVGLKYLVDIISHQPPTSPWETSLCVRRPSPQFSRRRVVYPSRRLSFERALSYCLFHAQTNHCWNVYLKITHSNFQTVIVTAWMNEHTHTRTHPIQGKIVLASHQFATQIHFNNCTMESKLCKYAFTWWSTEFVWNQTKKVLLKILWKHFSNKISCCISPL